MSKILELTCFSFLLSLQFINLLCCDASQFFKRGRFVGGNLGEPFLEDINVLSNNSYTVNDSWFDQILDHFDLKSSETWKQVS